MSKSQSLKRILVQAEEEEKRYDWLGAIEFHKKASDQVLKQEDFLKVGAAEERIGYCFHRAAFQAESQEDFKQRIHQAIEAYEKAHGFYEKLMGEQKTGRVFRCKAIAKYLGYWLTSDPSAKRKLLDECLELEDKALTVFKESGNMLEYGKTYNELGLVFFCRSNLEWDRQTLKSIVQRGLKWGQKTVAALSERDNPYETARAYLALATCTGLYFYGNRFISELEEQEENRLEAVKYLSKAIDLCREIGDFYLLGLAHLWLGMNIGEEKSIRHHEKTLECGKRTKDNFLIAWGLDFLTYWTYWKAVSTEDPDERSQRAREAMRFYEKAQYHYSVISFTSPRWGLICQPAGHAEHYFHLALWETAPRKRRELLEKSETSGMEALELAKDSDLPLVISAVLHVISKILASRALTEPDLKEKRSRLERALKYREKTIEISEQLLPFDYWDRGVMQNYLAEIKAEIAHIEPDVVSKSRLLEEAVLSKERCLKLIYKGVPYYERRGDIRLFGALRDYLDTYVTLLTRLYNLTKEPEHLRKAIEISQKAIESADKLDLVSLMAESYWKIAKAQDILGDHLKAAENFKYSSTNYAKAAKKIPQLKAFYQDYAAYMEAWSEIEKAKHYHTKKHYGQAKEHYKKAADFHTSTERWSYMGPNYLAWAQLEEAEDISRREQTEEAKDLFQQAAELFLKAEKSVGAKVKEIEARDEKEMAGALAKASHKRREYCLGRVVLEEAKVLDRQGDHLASSRKYGSAAEMFQEIARDEPEHSHKELQPIVYLCQAWQKMMMAEAKASSTMYGEAADLFKQAKEYIVDQPTSLLALANNRFCKALEAGTEFEIIRDLETYSTTKKHMEAAANYYLKAGFKNASEYAKATLLLFDAYMYITKAETETDPARKAQFYQMAEKLLPTSAGSYMKAKHPEKSEEVRKLLEGVKEKRQLATSLTELLHAPTITSTTTSFSTPTPTHEKAVGLERFEHADIQANLTTSDEVTIEEEVEIRLDLVNVAKESGLLVRVDNLVPPGFKVTVLPSQGSMENGSIDLKGKKLGPLKVETIKLSLRTTEPGVINLSPQVIYVDELGKFRTSKVEPVAVTVHPKLAFEFKTQAAQNAFDYMMRSFVEDYMRRRISLEKSGWRTLMDIVKHGKVSKSSVYGVRARRGRAISELERRGLIEERVFLGERGRGGKIVKVRICYEKETIKRYVDQGIMKIKDK